MQAKKRTLAVTGRIVELRSIEGADRILYRLPSFVARLVDGRA